MSGWLADLGLGVRLMRRRPAYAVAAVLTLALGIGIDTATWSVVDAVLVRPLPFPEPERLVSVMGSRPSRGLDRVSLSPADFLAFQGGARSFADLGAFVPFGTVDLTGEGDPVQLRRHLVSAGLLAARGVRPLQGRLFAPPTTGRRASASPSSRRASGGSAMAAIRPSSAAASSWTASAPSWWAACRPASASRAATRISSSPSSGPRGRRRTASRRTWAPSAGCGRGSRSSPGPPSGSCS